jgi:hypothetical protein
MIRLRKGIRGQPNDSSSLADASSRVVLQILHVQSRRAWLSRISTYRVSIKMRSHRSSNDVTPRPS